MKHQTDSRQVGRYKYVVQGISTAAFLHFQNNKSHARKIYVMIANLLN